MRLLFAIQAEEGADQAGHLPDEQQKQEGLSACKGRAVPAALLQ